MVNPDSEDLQLVSMVTEIPTDVLKTSLDTEERSHVELEDNYIFIVINIPIILETDSYDTLPLGIFITPDFIITLCIQETEVMRAFTENKYPLFYTFKKTRFLFQILYRTATLFLRYLQQINHRTDDIEQDLRHSMQNKEFFLLLELQKSLTYFTSALRGNGIVMEKLMRLRRNTTLHHLLKMYEEDEDLLEDVIIENKQAIEMVEMYSNILMSMSDTFASIISNNLNIVMKFLASITIILAVPTIIFSLWGMNVPVPRPMTLWGSPSSSPSPFSAPEPPSHCSGSNIYFKNYNLAKKCCRIRHFCFVRQHFYIGFIQRADRPLAGDIMGTPWSVMARFLYRPSSRTRRYMFSSRGK